MSLPIQRLSSAAQNNCNTENKRDGKRGSDSYFVYCDCVPKELCVFYQGWRLTYDNSWPICLLFFVLLPVSLR